MLSSNPVASLAILAATRFLCRCWTASGAQPSWDWWRRADSEASSASPGQGFASLWPHQRMLRAGHAAGWCDQQEAHSDRRRSSPCNCASFAAIQSLCEKAQSSVTQLPTHSRSPDIGGCLTLSVTSAGTKRRHRRCCCPPALMSLSSWWYSSGFTTATQVCPLWVLVDYEFGGRQGLNLK